MTSTTRSVYWAIRAFGPCPDVVVERVLADVPGSSVRGARKRLERAGVVECVGRTKDGRRKWDVARG